jgi:hypothetical protein
MHPAVIEARNGVKLVSYLAARLSPLHIYFPDGLPGTSHRFSSAFLAFEAGVKQRSIFEHGAGT